MTAKTLLQAYLSYYASAKGVGHTQVALNGYEDRDDAIVICANTRAAETTFADKRARPFMYPKGLLGAKNPLIWDNHALVSFFSLALTDIEALERALKTANDKLCRIREIAS